MEKEDTENQALVSGSSELETLRNSIPLVQIMAWRRPGDKPLSEAMMADEFDWSNELQGYMLGAISYGYMSTQILGGRLAERYGTKWLFGGSILSTSVLGIFTPVVAKWSPYAFIALRITEGVTEGVSFPVMYVMLTHWCPTLERNTLGTIVWSGQYLGTVFGMVLSGVIAASFGWEWVFYIFGIVGCVWCIAFAFLVYETPASHPRITIEEKTYIEKSRGTHRVCLSVPWMAIMTSAPIWGLTLAHIAYAWGKYTLLTSLPKYLHDVHHFTLSSNGFLSSLPYLAQFIIILLGGHLADIIIGRGTFSVGVVRKLIYSTGMVIAAICLLVVSYLGSDGVTVMLFLVVGSGGCAFAAAGYATNILDITPALAGTVNGITSTISNIPGFLAPQVVGWLTNTNKEATPEQWQKVFFVATGVYALGIISYVILASGKEQDWAKPPVDEGKCDSKRLPQTSCE